MPDLFEAKTMGTLVERLPRTSTFIRDTFFKNIETFPTKRINIDFVKGNRRLAPFVHPMIGGKTVPNAGYQTASYEPPLMAPNKITTAEELLNRLAGENPYSGKTAAERAVERLGKDMAELEDMITRREEWMATQAIFTGKIPVIGVGVEEEIDFGFENKETISKAADKWSAETADPIADIRKWRLKVQQTGHVNCNVMIMSSDVVNHFLNNKKVQALLDTKAYDLAAITPKELPNGATYVGTINEFGLDIYEYNEFYLDDWTNPETPEDKALVPEKTIALLSTSANYSRCYGANTIIDEDTNGFVTVEGEMVPETWVERNPARRFLQLNSRFLPVPTEVNSWLVAEVY